MPLECEPELNTDWILEEEYLLSLTELPQKMPLANIQIQALIIDAQQHIRRGARIQQPVSIINQTTSLLSKHDILRFIETVKTSTSGGGSLSFADILIWNPSIDPDCVQYETYPWGEFRHGTIFHDIELESALFILHSSQMIYVVLRETPAKGILRTSSRCTNTTKRVQFAITPASRSTRKHHL